MVVSCPATSAQKVRRSLDNCVWDRCHRHLYSMLHTQVRVFKSHDMKNALNSHCAALWGLKIMIVRVRQMATIGLEWLPPLIGDDKTWHRVVCNWVSCLKFVPASGRPLRFSTTILSVLSSFLSQITLGFSSPRSRGAYYFWVCCLQSSQYRKNVNNPNVFPYLLRSSATWQHGHYTRLSRALLAFW